MPDTPPSGPARGPGPAAPSAEQVVAPLWPLPPLTAAPRRDRWLPFLALAIALVALGAGIGAWVHPMPRPGPAAAPPEPSYTDEQIAAAKANICEAFKLVKQGVVVNTHRTNPVPGDEIGELATGVYGDVALYQGGDYLLDRLAAEPATSVELADATNSLGNTMKKLGVLDLTVESEPVRDPIHQAVNEQLMRVNEMCK